jgi:hypothetical protein
MHSPDAELIRTFSITVPLFPSITTGPDGASEPADPDGVGVGDFVLVAVGAGVGEGLVALGAAVGSFVALGAAVGSLVALGELLVAGIVVALGTGVVLGFDVGSCVVGAVLGDVGSCVVGAVLGDVGSCVVGAVLGEVGSCVVGAAGADGVALVDVVGKAVGVAVAPLLATVKRPRRLEVLPSDHLSTARIVCDPSASFVVSYGRAVPSAPVPAKSKGGPSAVRMGGTVRLLLSK